MEPSKFDELRKAYEKIAEIHTQDKTACLAFIPKCVNGIITNLSWPRQQTRFFILGEETQYIDYNQGMYQIDTIARPETREFWAFGLNLQLWKNINPNENLYPVSFSILFSVGKHGDSFDIKIGSTSPRLFTVNQSDNFQTISDYIFQKLLGMIDNGIHWSIEQKKGDLNSFYVD